MTEEQLLSKDRQKVAQFLSLADSGTVQAGLTPKQKQQQAEYIMRQRDIYANAAFRAQDKLIPKTSPAYLQNIQEMNQVKSNLENLAVQQKAIGDNQQQYLEDVENGRISKANYVDGKSNGLADIYSGVANMNIDDFGNLTFEVDGEYKPYAQVADYSLKSIDTANGILDLVDKVASSKKPMNKAQMGMFDNRIKSIINEASRSDVVSLIKDDLLPGFENIDIDDEMFKTENLPALKDIVVDIINNAASDINSSIPVHVDGPKENTPKLTQAEINRGDKKQRVQDRTNTIVDGLLKNPGSTIRQYFGLDGVNIEGNVITIGEGDDAQVFDMNRAEDIANLAGQMDAFKYGSDSITDLVAEQIPVYLDSRRQSRGEKRIMTSGLPGSNKQN